MCLTKLIFRKIAPLPDFSGLKRFLFIGPHPDDIEIGAGGTVARLVEEGKDVYFVVATNGCCGTDRPDQTTMAEVAALRKKEAEAALAVLGAKEVRILSFDDGGMYSMDDMTVALTKEICRVQPDIVFCPDPSLRTECHADHLKTGRAASSAYVMSGNRLLTKALGCEKPAAPIALSYYYTDIPNYYFKISKAQQARQFKALKAHVSQFPEKEYNGIVFYLKFRGRRFGIKRLKGIAEGFRVMPNLCTHCCAEKI